MATFSLKTRKRDEETPDLNYASYILSSSVIFRQCLQLTSVPFVGGDLLKLIADMWVVFNLSLSCAQMLDSTILKLRLRLECGACKKETRSTWSMHVGCLRKRCNVLLSRLNAGTNLGATKALAGGFGWCSFELVSSCIQSAFRKSPRPFPVKANAADALHCIFLQKNFHLFVVLH